MLDTATPPLAPAFPLLCAAVAAPAELWQPRVRLPTVLALLGASARCRLVLLLLLLLLCCRAGPCCADNAVVVAGALCGADAWTAI